MSEFADRVEALFNWATENNILEDPERLSKLHDEAQRLWGHFLSSRRIGEIVEETLRKMEK